MGNVYLLCHQFGDLWVAMAERVDRDASSEIEVASILNVPEIAPFAFHYHERGPHVGCYHVRRVVIDEGGSLRVGWRVMIR